MHHRQTEASSPSLMNDIDARAKVAREALDKAAALILEHQEIIVMMIQAAAVQKREQERVDQNAPLYMTPWHDRGPERSIEIEDPLGTEYLQDMISTGPYFAGTWDRLTNHIEFTNRFLRRNIHE